MERIAVFGGTFNPIHLGHVNLCCECQKLYSFDRVLLIPANQPPHKIAPDLASNEDRLEMVRLAIRDCPALEASDLEYQLGGRSYTVRTLEKLQEELPGSEFHLIVGSDMLRSFDHWREFERILRMARLVAGARHLKEYKELLAVRDSFGPLAARIDVVELPVREVSSTEVRQRLREGKDVSSFLEAGVLRYIKEHKLYV